MSKGKAKGFVFQLNRELMRSVENRFNQNVQTEFRFVYLNGSNLNRTLGVGGWCFCMVARVLVVVCI